MSRVFLVLYRREQRGCMGSVIGVDCGAAIGAATPERAIEILRARENPAFHVRIHSIDEWAPELMTVVAFE